MNKYKINPGLAAVLLVASLFAGWGTLLLVALLMLIFCEFDEKTKGIMVRVVSFLVGLSLVSLAWDLIYDGIHLIVDSLDNLIATINSYLDYSNQINILKLEQYLINPATNILSILNSIVNYLLTFAKFGFILAIVAGKPMKGNIITNKINEFVNKVINFINSIEFPVQPQPMQQPVQPQQNVVYPNNQNIQQ